MIYQFLWFFVIYGFLGWCIEVIYHAVKKGIIVNRGFLCGPICPVYGFGMITVLMIPGFASGEANAVAIFATGMILSTVIELFAGWVLDMAFHMRWWDYSSQPFNFRGYTGSIKNLQCLMR